MKRTAALWSKIKERHNSSLLVRFGVPTLLAGFLLGTPTLVAGIDLSLLGNPAYWQVFGFAVAFVLAGAFSILWGWFKDPVKKN